jgi:hypothetical protein
MPARLQLLAHQIQVEVVVQIMEQHQKLAAQVL